MLVNINVGEMTNVLQRHFVDRRRKKKTIYGFNQTSLVEFKVSLGIMSKKQTPLVSLANNEKHLLDALQQCTINSSSVTPDENDL